MRFFSTIVTLAVAAFTAVSAQASTKGNAITAPVAGDSITAGKSYTIKWMNVVGSQVTLTLVSGDAGDLKPVYTIVQGAPNAGSYTWTVPSNIPASTDYSIRISYDSNPNDYNYSDRFTFVSTFTGTLSASTASSTSAASTSMASTSTAESTTSAATTSAASTSTGASTSGTTMATTVSSKTTSTSSKTSSTTSSTSTSTGAPPSAANSNLSSPLAVIIAVLAAALFLH